jgi:hypothetical protein
LTANVPQNRINHAFLLDGACAMLLGQVFGFPNQRINFLLDKCLGDVIWTGVFGFPNPRISFSDQ